MRSFVIVLGLLMAMTAVTLLLLEAISSGVAVAIGMLGIGLIAISDRWKKQT